MTSFPLPRSVPALAACAALAFGLSACGGTSTTTTGGDDSGDDSDAGRVRLQQCLAKQGIDLPGPGQAGGQGPSAADREKLREAMQGECADERETAFGSVGEEDRQEREDAFSKFTACMREQGIDLPDRVPGQVGPPAGAGDIDRDDPDFQAAQKECADLRPELSFGGRGGN